MRTIQRTSIKESPLVSPISWPHLPSSPSAASQLTPTLQALLVHSWPNYTIFSDKGHPAVAIIMLIRPIISAAVTSEASQHSSTVSIICCLRKNRLAQDKCHKGGRINWTISSRPLFRQKQSITQQSITHSTFNALSIHSLYFLKYYVVESVEQLQSFAYLLKTCSAQCRWSHLATESVHVYCSRLKSVFKSAITILQLLLYLVTSLAFVAANNKVCFQHPITGTMLPSNCKRQIFIQTCSHQYITISDALKCIF